MTESVTGIIVIDKPAGWTSFDVAAKLRGVYHERHVGHGGTLDPMATGVLPVFLGRATRAISFFEDADKEYIAGLRLGMETDTEDVTGTVLAEHPVSVTREQVAAALAAMVGPQLQTPPMYSAIKINGQRLYHLARQGQSVERQPRPVVFHELELLDGADYRFRIRCSKGTYVRTVCADLGRTLGCGGCMSSLRRTRAGRFSIAQAVTMDELLAAEDPTALLLPIDVMFDDCPAVTVTGDAERRLRCGNELPGFGAADGRCRIYGADGTFLALGEGCGGTLRPIKSFFEV